MRVLAHAYAHIERQDDAAAVALFGGGRKAHCVSTVLFFFSAGLSRAYSVEVPGAYRVGRDVVFQIGWKEDTVAVVRLRRRQEEEPQDQTRSDIRPAAGALLFCLECILVPCFCVLTVAWGSRTAKWSIGGSSKPPAGWCRAAGRGSTRTRVVFPGGVLWPVVRYTTPDTKLPG